MTYSTISLSSFRWKFRVSSNPKLRQWFHFGGLIIYAQSKQEAIYTWYEEGNIWAWDCTQYVPTRPLNNTFPLAWRKSRKKSFSSFVFQQAAHDHTWYLSFFYTVKFFGEWNLHQESPIFRVKSVNKMPIFRVKSVKIYTGQKNLHGSRPWRPW